MKYHEPYPSDPSLRYSFVVCSEMEARNILSQSSVKVLIVIPEPTSQRPELQWCLDDLALRLDTCTLFNGKRSYDGYYALGLAENGLLFVGIDL